MNKLKLLIKTIVFMTTFISGTVQGKSLIVYFSHSNNTKVIAEYIKALSDADIVRLYPVEKYPTDYQKVVDQAKKEINDDYRPTLKTTVENVAQYDTIYVGSPNWWSTIAPPVATFLTSHDFNNKTIIPFITHEGSRFGRSMSDIKKYCPNATLLTGYACRGSQVLKAKGEVEHWLKEIKSNNLKQKK